MATRGTPEYLEQRKAWDTKYRRSEKGCIANKRSSKKHNEYYIRKAGPAGSAGPIGAAAQRERRSRPEYRLARKLGIRVKLARELLEVSWGRYDNTP